MDPKQEQVMSLIERYGMIDGGHHKQWLIDQIAAVMLGDEYDKWVAEQSDGDDGPNTYEEWDVGIAP